MLENFRKYLGKNKTFSGVIVCILFFLFYWGPSFKFSVGYLPDFGDTFHNIWVMSNSLKNLTSCGVDCMYEGNAYYPIKNSGAFAETLIGESLIYYPIFKVTGNPQLAFNITTCASFLLTSISLFYLLFLISDKFFLSVILANSFTYLPFRIVHVPHAQQISIYLIIVPVIFLIKFLKSGRIKDFLLFLIFFEIKAISFGYDAFILYLMVGALIMFWLVARFISDKSILAVKNKTFLSLAGGLLVITIFNLFYFYKPYIMLAAQGNLRSLWELNFYGADLLYFVSVPATNILYGNILRGFRNIDYNGQITTLFTGITPLIVLGLILKKVKKVNIKKIDHLDMAIMLSSLSLIVLSFILILGPNVKLDGQVIFENYPFHLLYKIGIGKFTRYVPAYIQLLVLSLTILLVTLGKYTRIHIRPMWMVIIVVVMLVEYRFQISHNAWNYSIDNIPEVYRELIKQKSDSPIVELPIQTGYSPAAEYYNLQMQYLYFSIFHGRKMLNGQSGFFPDEFIKNSELTSRFPSKESIQRLKSIGINTVVLHPEYYLSGLGDKVLELVKEDSSIREMFDDPKTGDRIFTLN